MPDPLPNDVTQLLGQWSGGDGAALDELMPLVYEELRRIAHAHMARERGDHTLQATALVNEAYLRLKQQNAAQWQNRAQFFAVAAQMMRHILVNYARRKKRAKRGAGATHVALDEQLVVSGEKADEMVALDDALQKLEQIHKRKSDVATLRFFGGLSVSGNRGSARRLGGNGDAGLAFRARLVAEGTGGGVSCPAWERGRLARSFRRPAEKLRGR